MSLMTVAIDSPVAAFRPGDEVTGQMSWDLPGPPERVEVSLVWVARAAGGSTERGVGASVAVERPGSRDRRTFSLPAPAGPCSYHGRLFDLQWRVEVVSEPGGYVAEAELVIGPRAAVTACPPGPPAPR